MIEKEEIEYSNILHAPIVQEIIDRNAFFQIYDSGDKNLFYSVFTNEDIIDNSGDFEANDENILVDIVLHNYTGAFCRIEEVSDLLIEDCDYIEITQRKDGKFKRYWTRNK